MSGERTKTILLTGAAQGIGRATARALAARGHRLGLIDLAEGPLRELEGELGAAGHRATGAVADVRDRDSVRAAVEALEAAIGPADVLIGCAGVGCITTVHDLDTAGLRQMLEVNVLGVAHAIEAVLPGMIARGSGHLIGIASVAGFRGLPWMPGYSASKAAVSTYLEGLRPPLKARGVVVSTVAPGFVRTGMTARTPFRRPMPMLEPEAAARHIVRVVDGRPRDYVFPLSVRLQMGLLRRMPNWAFDWMMDQAGPRALDIDY